MPRILLFFVFLHFAVMAQAQETVIEKNKYAPGINEKYHVLQNNTNIKHGLYQAFYKNKVVIASGLYDHGKKTGIWHFYNNLGEIVQHFNYNTMQATFLIRNELPPNLIQYEFLPKPAENDSLRLPTRVGGVLYGYLPYVNKFKVKNTVDYVEGSLYGILQIVVSPAGLMAECKLLVRAKVWQQNHWAQDIIDSYELKPELLKDDEKVFIPGSVNRQNVVSTINIYCTIKPNGSIYIIQ